MKHYTNDWKLRGEQMRWNPLQRPVSSKLSYVRPTNLIRVRVELHAFLTSVLGRRTNSLHSGAIPTLLCNAEVGTPLHNIHSDPPLLRKEFRPDYLPRLMPINSTTFK